MLVFRVVATADVSAGKANPQVYPLIAHFEALFAALTIRLRLDEIIHMGTLRHTMLVPLYLRSEPG